MVESSGSMGAPELVLIPFVSFVMITPKARGLLIRGSKKPRDAVSALRCVVSGYSATLAVLAAFRKHLWHLFGVNFCQSRCQSHPN